MCEWKAEYRQQRDPSMQFAVDKKQWGFIDGAGGAAILANQSWLAWLAAPCWPEEKDANKNLILTGGNLDDIWESSWVQSNHYWRKAAFQSLACTALQYSVQCALLCGCRRTLVAIIQDTVHCALYLAHSAVKRSEASHHLKPSCWHPTLLLRTSYVFKVHTFR